MKIILTKLDSWYEGLIANLPNIVVAILTIMLFVGIAKLTRKISRRFFFSKVENRALLQLLSAIAYFMIIGIGVFTALGVLHLDKAVTSLLAGAGVIGLALGFAFQDIAANFVSGIFIAFRQPYKIGDIVEIQEFWGTVSKIDLRTTSIVTFDDIEVLIPNKMMFTEPVKNFTSTAKRRLDIGLGVSYSDDLTKVESVVRDSLKDLKGLVKNEEIDVYFKEFGDSSINFDIRLWVEYPKNKNFLKTRNDAIIKVKQAFDDNGLTIPFPIRTVEMVKS